jgi:hypothetical protein
MEDPTSSFVYGLQLEEPTFELAGAETPRTTP